MQRIVKLEKKKLCTTGASKIPVLRSRDMIRKLKKLGFVFERNGKGCHEIWNNEKTSCRVNVPIHKNKDMNKIVVKQIIEYTGLSIKEFDAL
jgi:predicted RNA binding protein YcfA (HicA-like mRNA interferase family)